MKQVHKNHKLRLSFQPMELVMKHVFTVAGNSRFSTPIILTEIEYDGLVGFGEASLPPYLQETQDSVIRFLTGLDLSQFSNPLETENILQYVSQIAPGNMAAKASIDIAIHDLAGKFVNKPLHEIWGYDKAQTPYTSFTIGLDSLDMIKKKTQEAASYPILKVKLGKDNDKEIIEAIRRITDKPIYADVNQGWKDKTHALAMTYWLKERGVVFIEQPLPKEQLTDIAWLTGRSPIPVIADEGIQDMNDLQKFHGYYTGVNIKLMKCGGLLEARKMIEFARNKGMKVMIGCMTETSCAISAAAHLTPTADYADLDGSLLIKNDVFVGMKIVDGKITLNDQPGIGITKQDFPFKK